MRLPLITAALLASLALPFAASAQDEDDERDVLADLIANPLPQYDLGEEDNGWFFTRGDGSCRMYSFNDPLVLQADTDPTRSVMRFQMIDEGVPEEDGVEVQLLLVFRENPDSELAAFPATATVTQSMPASYVVSVPMQDLAMKYPDGFEVVLADASGQKRITRSNTMGSRKHLAALAQCEQK